jgi:DNA-binding transcriptional LysR family regulator
MDWNDLRFVVAVGRERTLAAAARKLRVDPTTVGRRIIAIEETLGARLFDRSVEGYLPTHAGNIAIQDAEKMEQLALSLQQKVAGSDERVAGPVRLTALDALFDGLIIPALPRLVARYPGLELTLSSGIDTLKLSSREADIALRPNKPTEPDAVAIRIGRMAMAAYVAADKEFGAAPPVIGLPRDRESLSFAQFLSKQFPESPIVVRANAESHLRSAVKAGLGAGFIDCFIGDSDPGLRRFWPDRADVTDLWAVTHVDMHSAPRVRAVLDFLIELHAENRDLLEGRKPRG